MDREILDRLKEIALFTDLAAKEEDLAEISKSIAENFMVPLSPRVAGLDDIFNICREAL